MIFDDIMDEYNKKKNKTNQSLLNQKKTNFC